jgi:hypothetical protein
MNTETQNLRVLAHLQSGRRLTALDALREYGVFRLSARIYDLKQLGHRIDKTMVRPDPDDPTKLIASYYLESKGVST